MFIFSHFLGDFNQFGVILADFEWFYTILGNFSRFGQFLVDFRDVLPFLCVLGCFKTFFIIFLCIFTEYLRVLSIFGLNLTDFGQFRGESPLSAQKWLFVITIAKTKVEKCIVAHWKRILINNMKNIYFFYFPPILGQF